MQGVLIVSKNPRSKIRERLGLSFTDEVFEMVKAQTKYMADKFN